MALTRITSPTALADEFIVVSELTATSINNVSASTTGSIYMIEADNTSNEYPVYVKIVDAASATAGVTQPQLKLRIPKQAKTTFSLLSGHAYSAGLCLWATTGSGDLNTGIPENTITVKILVTD
jgi:uncharacterized protein with WD repeat